MGAHDSAFAQKELLSFTGVLYFHPDNRAPLSAKLLSVIIIGIERLHPWITDGKAYGITISPKNLPHDKGIPGGVTLEFVEAAYGGLQFTQGALHAFRNFIHKIASEVAGLDIPGVSSVSSSMRIGTTVGLHYAPTTIKQLNEQYPGMDHTSTAP